MSKHNLIPVESSNIAAIGHDGADMYVQFKNGGLYCYEGVPHEDYLDLMAAESKGKALRATGLTGKKVVKPEGQETE